MLDSYLESIDLGRQVVSDGRLSELRQRLGFSRNVMSEMLHTSLVTYISWERNPLIRLWPTTASRIGRFYQQAETTLEDIQTQGIDLREMMPFHLVATFLGIPQEVLLQRYRDGDVKAEDFGILGIWMNKDQFRDAAKEGPR